MVGHSEIVGKPAAFMLMAEGATVTVCHHMTRSVAAHSRRADAVLVAVGKPKFLHADMVKPGAAVIDIGINQITGPNGETMIVGDVDTDGVKEVASWVTPVPGGVGPVTVAMFMRNAIAAHDEAARRRLARLTLLGRVADEPRLAHALLPCSYVVQTSVVCSRGRGLLFGACAPADRNPQIAASIQQHSCRAATRTR